MPVSTMISQAPPPPATQRATCAAELSTGTTPGSGVSPGSSPCSTARRVPAGIGSSAAASAQVATKNSVAPAAASAATAAVAPSP